jgi:hypothetical protein
VKALLAVGAAALLGGAGVYLAMSSHAAAPAASGSAPAAPAAAPAAPAASPASPSARSAPIPRVAIPVPHPRAAVPGRDADLHDADPHVRAAALHEAITDGNADTPLLLAASRDPDLSVSILATTELGKLYADNQLPASELVSRIRDHGLAEKTRVSALNGLGVVASAAGASTLVDLLSHGDTTERRSAAILLQHQDAAVAVPALITALSDPDDVVRANAAESLRALARGRDFGADPAAWSAWWQARSR